jgi:SAM-dependent MidA family methyltransferase
MRQAAGSPRDGYYTRHAGIGHEGGDFYTAPETSPAFASLLALQIGEIDRALGSPDPFYLIEAGPGNGTLMEDLLSIFRKADPAFYARTLPLLVELPGVLEKRQRERLSCFDLPHPPRWIALPNISDASLSEKGALPPPSSGVVLGNEFLDALPVHRLRVKNKRWEECYVEKNDSGGLSFVWGEISDPALHAILAEGFGSDLSRREGQETEICLEIPTVLGFLDGLLERGFMLWVDYGDIAEELRSERRREGTLLAYRNHTVSGELLDSPGKTDLTAFVDFSRVAGTLKSLGYRLEGYTDQMSWLMGLGFEDWVEANGDRLSPEALMNAGILLHPLKMGRLFKVLLMSRGILERPSFSGFRFGGLRPPVG